MGQRGIIVRGAGFKTPSAAEGVQPPPSPKKVIGIGNSDDIGMCLLMLLMSVRHHYPVWRMIMYGFLFTTMTFSGDVCYRSANSAFHPYGVVKWVIVRIITWIVEVETIKRQSRASYSCRPESLSLVLGCGVGCTLVLECTSATESAVCGLWHHISAVLRCACVQVRGLRLSLYRPQLRLSSQCTMLKICFRIYGKCVCVLTDDVAGFCNRQKSWCQS